jgi:uncharacterized membrane protein YkvA (DUF1232 family)
MADDKLQRTKDKTQLKSRMTNLLMFLPNLVRLCFNLLADKRVPIAEKALFAGAIIYFISPLDFIPDVLPFIGQVDDIYVIALTLLRLVNRTDGDVVRELWKGGGDIIQLSDSIAALAPRFLPKRVNRVLTSRVEMASSDKLMQAVKDRKTPVVREFPQTELPPIDNKK